MKGIKYAVLLLSFGLMGCSEAPTNAEYDVTVDIEELRGQIEELKSTVSDLQTEVETLTYDNEDLQYQMERLEGAIIDNITTVKPPSLNIPPLDKDIDNDGLWDYDKGGIDRDLDNDGMWDQ